MASMFGLFAITIMVGMAGIMLAAIFYQSYIEGYMIDEYLSGTTITIADVMTMTIVFMICIAVLCGAIYYARR